MLNTDEYRLQQAQTQQDKQDSHHTHSHEHDPSHRHRHRHHHHSLSTASSVGYMSGHSTTIAALAAAATAVAAASPTTPATTLPNPLARVQTNAAGGFAGPEMDRSQDESLQQQQQQLKQERQASTTSGTGLPIDPAAVRAAAAALERMQREQSRNAARVLQAAAGDLDDLCSSTSQRLDAAYGSVLFRLSALQDTVLALRSLASAARATNRRFTAEAEAITHEIDQQVTQLEVHGHTSGNKESGVVLTPADQQQRLEQLSERVHRGRQTIQDLAERVETVRSKVQRWEQADRAWQERTRTRLKALWVVVSTAVLLLVVLLAVMLRLPGGGNAGSAESVENVKVADSADGVDIADSAYTMTSRKPNFPPGFTEITSTPVPTGKFYLTFPNRTAHGANGSEGTSASGQEDDPLQRLLDEL